MKNIIPLFLISIISTQVFAQFNPVMSFGSGESILIRTVGWAGLSDPTHIQVSRTGSNFGSNIIATLPYRGSQNYDWVDSDVTGDDRGFYYRVRAVDSSTGAVGPWGNFVLGRSVLITPRFSVAAEVGQVKLIGSTPPANGRPNLADVYRGTTNPPTNLYTSVPMPNRNSFEWIDTQVQVGTRYYYRIIMKDTTNGIETPFSQIAEAVPMASPFGPIAAIAYTDSVSVRWIGDVDVPGDQVNSYEVWRKSGDESLQFLTTVSKEDTFYTDRQVSLGEVYEYEVRSIRNSVILSETDIVKPVIDFDRHLIADGSGEVQFSDAGLFSGNSGTIEFRMKVSPDQVTSTNGHSILNKHSSSGSLNGFNFILFNGGLSVQIKDGTGNVQGITTISNTDVADDLWHHVALTYQWGGISVLYVDGEEQGTISNTAQINLASEPFRVADSPDEFWDPFVGRVDEVRVWDQPWNQQTISDLSNRRVFGNEAGLQGVWRFDVPITEGIIYDDGVNGFNGTATGNLTLSDPETALVNASYNNGEVTLNWDFQLNNPITEYLITRRQVGSPEDSPGNSVFVRNLSTNDASGSLVDNNPLLPGAEYEYRVEARSGFFNVLSVATDQVAINDGLGGRLILSTNLEGQDGFAEINENITNNQRGTIEFRFRSSQQLQVGESVSLLGRHSASGSNNGFNFIHSASNLSVQIKQGGVSTNLGGTENLLDGEWHHVALVYDWDGENQLYIDGAEAATASVSNISVADEPLRIGKSLDDFWSPYKGQIDELRLWSKQLTAGEVMAGKDMRMPGSTTDLAAVWHFDEQIGYTVANDEGANNFNGALQDGAFFNQDPGSLTFSSGTNGFNETAGNGGRIEGEMVITVEGNFFKIPDNPGRVVDQALFDLPRQISATLPNGQPFRGPLIQGLTPLLSVSEDGRSATLRFDGQADIHAAEYSQANLYIELDSDIFLTDNAVALSNGANTNISYILRDNTVPSLIRSIPDLELFVTDDQGITIIADEFFSDPDFDQDFLLSAIEESPLIFTTLDFPNIRIDVDSGDPGVAELLIRYDDSDGGSVSDTVNVIVSKLPQNITFDPVGLLELPDFNTTTLSASASSGLPVDFALLEGNGTINSGDLTVNESGVFTIVAFQPGDNIYAPADSVFQTFGVVDFSKEDQSITFTDDLNDLIYGDGPVNLFATSSSGLPVTYTSSGPIAIDGASFSILGAGEASISANQAGDDDFNPAPEVTINFNIAKATLTVTADDQTRTYLTNDPVFTITYEGFVGDDHPQNLITEPIAASGTLPTTDVGNYPIVASGGSDANYDFIYIDGTLIIEKADQVLNFDAIPDLDIADTNQVKLIADSSVEDLVVNYVLDAGEGSIVDDIVTVNNSGTFIVRATQEGNSNYNPASDVTQSFNVIDSRKTDQTITFTADLTGLKYGDEDIMLSASSTSGLEVNFATTGPIEINGNQLSIIGAGDASVTAIQNGDAEVNPATPVTVSFNIAKAKLVASVEEIQRTYKEENPSFSILYEGFVGNDSEIDLDELPVASTLATIDSDAGLYDITLSGGSDDNYEFELIIGSLTIIKARQFINAPVVGIMDLSTENQVSLVSSTISGLPVTLELLSGDGIIDDNQMLTINNTGIFNIKYSQPGNINYEAAPDVILTIRAIDSRKSDQSISFDVIESKAYGDQIILTASASSGLAISYQLVSGEGILENGVLTITGVGEYEIMATQDGDDIFNPARPNFQLFLVSKAPLTVRASDQTIAEGEAIPALTVDYDGFVFSDGVNDLAELPVASTLATTESPAGDYEITLNGGSDDLYDFIYVNGTLTITSQQILGIEDTEISIYPNPTTSFIQVKGGEFTDFQVISMDGKLARNGRLSKDIDVRDLQAGQYLLKLSDEKGRTSAHRIIKK